MTREGLNTGEGIPKDKDTSVKGFHQTYLVSYLIKSIIILRDVVTHQI